MLNRPFTFWSNRSEMLDVVIDVGSISKSTIGAWKVQPSNQLVKGSWNDCPLTIVPSVESSFVIVHFSFCNFFGISVLRWRILSIKRRTFWVRIAPLCLSVCAFWATIAPGSAGITERKIHRHLRKYCLLWYFLNLLFIWYIMLALSYESLTHWLVISFYLVDGYVLSPSLHSFCWLELHRQPPIWCNRLF